MSSYRETLKKKSELRLSRMEIGEQILLQMEIENEFPLKDMYKISDKMMQYFYEMNYEEKLEESGSSWLPDNDYWRHNFKTLRALLRDGGMFLEWIRTEGKPGFVGLWDFRGKKEFVRKLEDDYKDVLTRTHTYNDKHDDGGDKWDIRLPGIEPVPELL